jgi:hypothetical protein
MATPPPSDRAAKHVPGYGARLEKVLAEYDLTLTDLGNLSCLSSSTISRAVNQDLVSVRTDRRLRAALQHLRRQHRERRHGHGDRAEA